MKSVERPLVGARVVVARARRQASKLSAGLKALGADVIEIPFIEIRSPRSFQPLDDSLRRISEYDWLILTSVNGVEALAGCMKRLRVSPEQLAHLRIAAIGPATRAAIEQLGLKVNLTPRQYVAESVVERLRGKVEKERVLIARAKIARDVIPRELRKMGAHVDVVEAYETVVPRSSKAKLQSVLKDPKRRPHVVTFTSSSTVKNFVELLGGSVSRIPLNGIAFASIGPVTSATLRESGLPVNIEASEYTIAGLTRAMVDWAKGT